MQKGYEMKVLTKREKQRRIKLILREVKKAPVIDGYFVINYSSIARETGLSVSIVSTTMRKLQESGAIKIKQSIGLFGSMHKKGIKILGEKND